MAKSPSAAKSLDLVSRIEDGSLDAWHELIDRYGNLIHSVIRRYLPSAEEDDRRTLFVTVLEQLYKGKLRTYDGRSRLSTWLVLFTRSRCFDYLRHVSGRRGSPKWLLRLSGLDQEVYRLHYLKQLGWSVIRSRLSNGTDFGADRLAGSLQRIDAAMPRQFKRRLAYDAYARSIGWTSGQLLALMIHLEVERELAADKERPDAGLLEEELERRRRQVLRCVERLPETEREVIRLRFFRGWTAGRVADHLDLRSQRKVYSVEERALRRLRHLYDDVEPST